MDLSGAGGYFGWTNSGWAEILEVGQAYGWVPAGTGPPRGTLKADWGYGPYFGNDGQRFYARDAQALADALERALAAPAVEWPRIRAAQTTDYLEAELRGGLPPVGGRVSVQEFSPEDAANIREFIEFCRAGSFRIF
jgi:glycosyltransferase involved in cell wall biosynthesis